MFLPKYLYILILITLIGCKKLKQDVNAERPNEFSSTSITEKDCFKLKFMDVSKFITIDSLKGTYHLNIKEPIPQEKFDSLNSKVVIKESEPFYFPNKTYYILQNDSLSNYKIEAILYEGYADIVSAVFYQLNTYNNENQLIDSLLLDNLFDFEIKYENQLSVEKNCIITIKKKQDGVITSKVQYKLDDLGSFQKV